MTGTAVMGVSVPNYWLGLVLVIIFAVELSWLPASGMGMNGSDGFSVLRWADLHYLVLPVHHPGAGAGRHHRPQHARRGAGGARPGLRHHAPRQGALTEFAVVRHVLKNAAPGMLAVMGLQFGYLMGGSILVEPVFAWPGSGTLLGRAIVNRDVPVLQGAILSLALIFVATNLVGRSAAGVDRPAGAPRMTAQTRLPLPAAAPVRLPARPGYWGMVGQRLRRDPVTVIFCLLMLVDRAGGGVRAADLAVRPLQRKRHPAAEAVRLPRAPGWARMSSGGTSWRASFTADAPRY